MIGILLSYSTCLDGLHEIASAYINVGCVCIEGTKVNRDQKGWEGGLGM